MVLGSKGKKVRKKSSLTTFFKGFGILLLTIGIISCLVGAGFVSTYIVEALNFDIGDYQLNVTSYVYGLEQSGEYVEYEHLGADLNSMWVSTDNIPKHMGNAFVAIEDERYFGHFGVDIKRTFGAVINFVLKGSSDYGGSTITQQLVKNITGDKSAKPDRKIREMFRAVALETQMNKEQILEYYMNIIYLGEGCYGVQAASLNYFNKDVSKLSIAEAACIAGITQSPTRFDPFVNPEENKRKQEVVLAKMLELGKISPQERDDAVKEKLVFNKNGSAANRTNYQSYFTEALIKEVVQDLINEKKMSEAAAKKLIYNNGLKIYSTVNVALQRDMEKVFYDMKNFPKLKGSVQPQAAMVVMDPYTGAIIGLIGGAGPKSADMVLNRAIDSPRQPASSIKPVSIYGPAIEKNLIAPASVVIDETIKIGDWEPKNYYNSFKGAVTIREAVIDSMNIPAIKIGQMLGAETSYAYLTEKLGISTLDGKQDKNLSALALGGMSTGVTVKELTAAYASFANEGIYSNPYTYTQVLDQNNKVILEKHKKTEQVFSPQTAYLMTSILKSTAEGPLGRPSLLASRMPSAGKTGTTSDDKDRWYIGYTPYYIAGVWYGYDIPAPMPYSTTGFTAHKLWKLVMTGLHDGLKNKSFEKPQGIVTATVCKYSGNRPLDTCPLNTDEFKAGTVPKIMCDGVHKGAPTPSPSPSPTPESSPSTGPTPPSETVTDGSTPVNTTASQSGQELITPKPAVKTTAPVPIAN